MTLQQGKRLSGKNLAENERGGASLAGPPASDLWHDEAAVWRKELEAALEGLRTLEQSLHEHGKRLQDHLNTIAAAKTGAGDAGEQSAQRQVHEALRERHHTMMDSYKAITALLTAATE